MSETPYEIKALIEERLVKVALDPSGERNFSVGPKSAKRLGYDAAVIDALPPQATESFAEVGNPLALGELRARWCWTSAPEPAWMASSPLVMLGRWVGSSAWT
jgi:hypothetical protein